MYENILVEKDVLDKPHRIFNLDEAGLGTDPIASKVFVQVSSRTAYLKTAWRKIKLQRSFLCICLRMVSKDVATRLFNEEKGRRADRKCCQCLFSNV